MNTSLKARLPFLESSRGLAALIVLFAHFQFTMISNLNESWMYNSPIRVFIDGPASVLYFFILSGYVLTLSLKNFESVTFLNYLKFIFQRVFRIFPAFIFVLILTFILIQFPIIRQSSWLDQFWKLKINFYSLIKQSILIIRIPYAPEQRLIPQDWSLTIEIIVSLLLPVLVFLSRKSPIAFLIFIYYVIQFLHLDPFVFDFSIGVFIAQSKNKILNIMKNNFIKISLLIISLLFICSDYYFPLEMQKADVILIHHKSWGLAIILCLIISSVNIQKILSIKILTFLGKISYSLYLVHLIILYLMTNLFFEMKILPFFFIYLFLTILVSSLSFYLIEKPFNNYGKTVSPLKSTSNV